ncbi:YqeG family HAD IIIA-type phosphatase [Longicatena caecimuris]|uniref:YqeG family HAD IIIA-type phosphatase n=1 Tax=Longicatena caecimuris TaxID=1796635 RepID=UPI003AB2988B
MLKLFTPNYYIHRYTALRPAFLKEQGIQLLICDIDNTLVPHDVAVPDDEAIAFLKSIQDAGIQIVFISNNVEERVATFAKGLNIPFYPFAMKPLPKTYRKMLKDFHVKRDVVAVLGDQLMTDILGANVMRFYTILTAQVVERDHSFTKVNRVFENIVFSLLKVTGKLVKGEYDE